MLRILLIDLLTLLGAVSCTNVETTGGRLRIQFETGMLQTKAGEPDGVVADGGGIAFDEGNPDIVILVAAANDAIVAKYPGSGTLEGTPNATQASISFDGLTASATYTVYAFANTQGFWTMTSGGEPVSDLTALTSATQVEALQFEPTEGDLKSDGTLLVKSSRLPLSAKGTVTLTSAANGEISLPLLRCVAKVTAVFENQYGSGLTLYDFCNKFYHMLPSTGYVVPHESDFPVEWASADPLEAEESELRIESEDDPKTENREDMVSTFWYVLPSIGPYTCDISFYLDAGRTAGHSYTALPVHDDHARDISQLARNQHLTITTRISKGESVSFNFEVAGWGDPKIEKIEFD